jgi:isoleucyl-tRNA synthetase
MPDPVPEKPAKSTHAEREEKILAFWKEKDIFAKTLEKNKASGKEFIFYEGPPTANGRPGIHHLEARAFKDAMPRYKTMRGYHVRRKGGWDTHGLPVELQVEKELGLKSKKEIESYGIDKFNDKCKESVWKYVREWEEFTERIGYWVDLKDPYVTYKPDYIESLWNIVQTVDEKKLLYKDFKVVPWCPRCGTGLSSHELGQPDAYQMDKDLSVTAKFKVVGQEKTFILAWTTTPWTLPGNVALAVGEKIEYVKVKIGDDFLVLAKARVEAVLKDQQFEIVGTMTGKDLVGWTYEPLYGYMKTEFESKDPESFKKAYKVYAADFVNTEDGTGIVHIAVMYGQDDFDLGTKVGLPKFHLVHADGTFHSSTGPFAGRFVKDEAVAVDVIKDLAGRAEGSLLFKKEKFEHSYPHCWRCKTPLIYYARDSWYIRMSSLRDELVSENKKINWEPSYIKEGRFGEWLSEVKDWAISRERYWGTPLPVWLCNKCEKKKVVGSVEEVSQEPKNQYWVMRHGEAENNVQQVMGSLANGPYPLTEKGKQQVQDQLAELKKIDFDLIVVSPFVRTKETAEIVVAGLGLSADNVTEDVRLGEWNTGVWNGKSYAEFLAAFPQTLFRFENRPENGECYADVKMRMGEVLYEYEAKYSGKKILFITHEVAGYMMLFAARGMSREACIKERGDGSDFLNAQIRKVDFKIIPHDTEYELDLHKPFIDEVKFACSCGGEMSRVKEVMDVWFDSGAMPFAQDHYPFEHKKDIDGGFLGRHAGYPADFISEAIDQTRGWFYTLHAIGVLTGKGHAYKNVVCLGHILDAQGKKMSKSIGNVVDPWTTMNAFGADAVRFWMYSVNQPGESKNFDIKTVDEVVKKVFNLTLNVLAFYKMYDTVGTFIQPASDKSDNVLDQWILAKLNQLMATVTSSLETYKFLEPTRAIRDFVADLSQWYVRRSRDRFKEDGPDKAAALATTKYVMTELAKLLAPFTPFLAEHMYQELGGEKESVHLEEWPVGGSVDEDLLADMNSIREMASRGLEARTNAKINVRQPLALLKVKDGRWTVKNKANGGKLLAIVKDEVNVKAVSFVKDLGTDVELDTTLTPELKEEGDLRELIRKIQDMRKEKGLAVGDRAILTVSDDVKDIVSRNEEQIKKVAGLTEIKVGTAFELSV